MSHSKVLLGFPGQWAHDNCEPSDHYTSKIGGLPDWPFTFDNLDSSLIWCRVCGGKLCLVAQVYAPIESGGLKIEERVVFVFGCVTPNCGTNPLSWRVLRVQKLDDETEVSENVGEEVPLVEDSVSDRNNNWLGNLDDDSIEDIDLDALSKALSEAGSLAASNSSKPSCKSQKPVSVMKHSPLTASTRAVDTDTPVVPCFYVYTLEDSFSKNVSSMSLNVCELSIRGTRDEAFEDDNEEEAAESSGPMEEETYEYDKAFAADRTSLKFMKQLAANPQQCLRYSFGGKPLLATDDVGEPGKCTLCGSLRHYEMQLMSPLIYFLQDEADDSQKQSLSDWDWMTLIIYTCSKSCSRSSGGKKFSISEWIVVEEAVAVQSEKPLHELLQLGYFS